MVNVTQLKMVDLQKAYDQDYYTIIGCNNYMEFIKGYKELLKQEEIGEPEDFFYCEGKTINEFPNFNLKEKYPNKLKFLFFPLNKLNVGKLAIFKIKMRDRWFSDVIDNNSIDNN